MSSATRRYVSDDNTESRKESRVQEVIMSKERCQAIGLDGWPCHRLGTEIVPTADGLLEWTLCEHCAERIKKHEVVKVIGHSASGAHDNGIAFSNLTDVSRS